MTRPVSFSAILLQCLACSTAPPVAGPAFVVNVFTPEDGAQTIRQGGDTAFEIGTEEVVYEVVMSPGFSGIDLLAQFVDLPNGVRPSAASQKTLDTPFTLEPEGAYVHVLTLEADNNAVPGTYDVMINVSGVVDPDGAILTGFTTFELTVTDTGQ